MGRRAWACGAIVLLAACGGSGGGGGEGAEADVDRDYLETTRFEFIRQCQRDGRSEDACLRTLECLEEEIPFDEYVQLDLDRAAGFPVDRLEAVLAQCANA